MEKKIFMVTEYYTPYKHNNCTERENVHLFENLHWAVDYIKGTYAGGVMNYKHRVKVDLKEGCKPEYEIVSGVDGIVFKVKEECIREGALQQGGYVYLIRLEEMEFTKP